MSTTDFLKTQTALGGSALPVAIGIGTFSAFLLILQAWCLAQVINGAIFDHHPLDELMPYLWGMLALLISRALLSYAAEHTAFQAAAAIKHSLRRRLFEHLQALGPLYLSGERSGDIAATITDGVEALDAYYARYLPSMALAAIAPLCVLVFVFPMDWRSALVMVLTAPLIPFFMIMIGKGAERLNQRQWKQLARMGAHFLDTIQGLTTLKLFNASRREAAVIARISDDYRVATMRVLRVAFLSSLALEFFSTVSIAIVAVLIGFRLYFGELDFFTGFFVLLLAPEFYLPLRSLGTHYHARMDAIGAAERIVDILQAALPATAATHVALPRAPFQIEVANVHYTFQGGREALRGIQFDIKPGEHLAIVGPSGAGKSTFINMLLGFIQPQNGEIRINGTLLNSLDPAGWRQCLAWVPQNPHVFHGTVRDNLCLGLHNVVDDRLYTALAQAFAREFVDALPQGLDTLIGEGGHGLSGGQIQRLALARCFLRDAPLVILDEPTANLDSASEAMIQQAITNMAGQRTLISVAHRLSTVERADRILVFDQGHVAEQGTHDSLMAAQGLYCSLVQSQDLVT